MAHKVQHLAISEEVLTAARLIRYGLKTRATYGRSQGGSVPDPRILRTHPEVTHG